MLKTKDIKGERFGLLTVHERAGSDRLGNAMWRCTCECGGQSIVSTHNLKRGHTKSCGCLQKESVTTHSGTGTRLYRIWEGMKRRCYEITHAHFKDYGGRGITVCDEWLRSFEAFRDWALANGYRDDLTIDRKDNDGPYSPDNCHWATHKAQQNNMRSNRAITYKGETRTLAQWAELAGINKKTLQYRLNNGWSVEQAITTPTKGAIQK